MIAEIYSKLDYISNHMAQDFLRKKCIERIKKTQIKKSGTLDLKKLQYYKFKDNIFENLEISYDGDSYGFIIMLDMSGSMSNIYFECCIQVLLFSMFCHKVNIPFQVFGFSDSSIPYKYRKLWGIEEDKNVYLFEFFNNSLNKKNFKENCLNFINKVANEKMEGGISPFSLSGTPLNASMLKTVEMVENFQTRNNCKKINYIVLTDGEATDTIHSDSEVLNVVYRNRSFLFGRREIGDNTNTKLMFASLGILKKILNCQFDTFQFKIVDTSTSSLKDNQDVQSVNKKSEMCDFKYNFDEIFLINKNSFFSLQTLGDSGYNSINQTKKLSLTLLNHCI